MLPPSDASVFTFELHRLVYRTYGRGPRFLLAFHGFGQTGSVFGPMGRRLGDQYTVLAVDLFFHGWSQYGGTVLLTKSDWQRLITAFLDEQRIGRVSVAGFSMGGRFALTLAETMADRLDELILLAPDGITPSNWYRLATTTLAGRWLFRGAMQRFAVLLTGGKILTQLGLLNRSVTRLVERTLTTPERRRQVYEVWTQFRRINPDRVLVSRALNQHNVTVQLFTGLYDRLVPARFIIPLTNRLRRYELTGLPTGHNHIIELAADRLAQRAAPATDPPPTPRSGQ